jgi:hypothetical protein
MKWYARMIPRFRLRSILIAIALITLFLHYVAIPTWNYYQLPASTRAILTTLGEPLRMPTAGPISLEKFLKTMIGATATPKGRNRLPTYVEPRGLQEAGVSLDSPVTVTTDFVPIKDTLGKGLKEIGLGYYVEDGLLRITSAADAERALRENPKQARRP